jgi:hypothetical protein
MRYVYELCISFDTSQGMRLFDIKMCRYLVWCPLRLIDV